MDNLPICENRPVRRHIRETYSDDLLEEVRYHFDKIFSFKRPADEWQLPLPELLFTSEPWTILEMTKLKKELNAMKDKLNDFDLESWHKHTRTTNYSSFVSSTVRRLAEPELLTQAWLKLYEMLSRFPVIPNVALETQTLNSIHLCEAPGAFIAALNHFLKLRHPNIKWEWLGTSLNPHYEENTLTEMINEDRFMLQTLGRWQFGADYTGDIMTTDNLKGLVAESTKLGPILLITADGSFDCQSNPADQEITTSMLHFCEVVTALHILSAANTPHTKAMFPLLKIPEDFIEQLIQCAELFKSYQEEVLERNIRLFLFDQPTAFQRIKRLKNRIAEEYMEICNLRPLSSLADEIIGKARLNKAAQMHTCPRLEEGTFNERRQREQLPPLEKLQWILSEVSNINLKWSGCQIKWLKFPQRSVRFSIIEGKPINTIRSSKFCLGPLVNFHYQTSIILRELNIKKSYEWSDVSSELSEPVLAALKGYCPDIFRDDTHIINFKSVLWSYLDGGNEEMERKAFSLIFDVAESLWRDVNLIIQGYPMITQFNAGVVFMLGHLFEEVGFIRPQGGDCALVFRKFRSRDHTMTAFVERLIGEAEQLQKEGEEKAVVAIIPICDLIDNEFYDSIFTVNALTMKEQLMTTINEALSASP